MRLPLPSNRLVQLTLVGALLTVVVAAGLALPADQTPITGEQTTDGQVDANAPTPNQKFTPAVDDSGGHDEYEEYEDDDEYEDEDEDEEHDEHEDE
ncbi:MAG: hypothetical protein V5A39_04805 [Haloarculaceae archaeon]